MATVDYTQMLTVPQRTNTTGTGAAANTASTKTMADYDSFLKLLVAEMKNQDPTNPMDATQYVAQLASFSQVEQSVQMNSKLTQLLQASAVDQASSMIGKTVTSADGLTTGVVKEVKLVTDGVLAMLQGGGQIVVGPGVTIS